MVVSEMWVNSQEPYIQNLVKWFLRDITKGRQRWKRQHMASISRSQGHLCPVSHFYRYYLGLSCSPAPAARGSLLNYEAGDQLTVRPWGSQPHLPCHKPNPPIFRLLVGVGDLGAASWVPALWSQDLSSFSQPSSAPLLPVSMYSCSFRLEDSQSCFLFHFL